MKLSIITAICVFVFSGLAVGQNRSVYTSTKTGSCRTIKQSSEGAGHYVGECPGTAGYKAQVLEDDLRQSINIITPAKKKFELDFWGFYSGFSTVGEKIEWRVKGSVPVALISRFNVADAEDSTKNTSYLIVSKSSRTMSCVTDIVEPGAGQNETARALADAALRKPCKSM
ncbi:MAG TPA: hypothetical protein PLP07_12525 [Pyrinomonadaceae bacterium]|nr:hypothetical protein [Pyrinomonadaceae bacterium]